MESSRRYDRSDELIFQLYYRIKVNDVNQVHRHQTTKFQIISIKLTIYYEFFLMDPTLTNNRHSDRFRPVRDVTTWSLFKQTFS